MMKDGRMTVVCPLCGKTYHGPGALSREDNETMICPDCGSRQALESLGVGEEERERIIGIIHGHKAQ